MRPRNKLILTAAGLLLLALAVGLWQTPQKPGPSAASPERARSVERPPRTSPPSGSRPARDFSTFVKLSTKGEFPKLTREQIESYLAARSRSASALLTAFRIS